MIKQSKFIKGELIKDLNELMDQEFIFHQHKVIHRGWFQNWQLYWAILWISECRLYKAEKNDGE
jgi:hypothetical protein